MSNRIKISHMIPVNYIARLRPAVVSLALTALMLMPGTALAEEVFAQLAEMNHVECTYVSGRFAHNKQRWRSNSGQHAMDLSRGFSSLYSYQCYSEEAVNKARAILKDYLKKNKDVVVVMKTTQGHQEYVVYEKFMGDDKITQMIIWNSDAPNVCEIVVIDWIKGLERGSSSYSDSDVPATPGSQTLMSLNSLGELGKLGELGDLEQLCDTLGYTLGESITEALSGLGDIDWEAAAREMAGRMTAKENAYED